jgi:hypothetical protein
VRQTHAVRRCSIITLAHRIGVLGEMN